MLDKIVLPAILVGNKNSIEIITHIHQLERITRMTYTTGSLNNAIVLDSDNLAYVVKGVVKIGNHNPWWKIEYFNPMLNVELILEKVNINLFEAKRLIETGIKIYPDYWDNDDFDGLLVHIWKLNTVSQIIQYLKQKRGIS